MIPSAIFGSLLMIAAFVLVIRCSRDDDDDDFPDYPGGYR
jgi:hypothetical protein